MMLAKISQWGALLAVYGLAALILPFFGIQLRIFNLFGESSQIVAIGSLIVGGLLFLAGKGSSLFASRTSLSDDAGGCATPPPLPRDAPAGGHAPPAAACSKCGAVVSPGDQFCMQCGAPLAQQPPTAAPSPVVRSTAPAKKKRGCGVVLLALLLVAGGAVAWFFFGGGLGAYHPPQRTHPALPQRMAGTLTEFPVDPSATNRMEPASVVSQSFEPGGKGSAPTTVSVPAETFPPGLNTGAIPQMATTMTSCVYRGDPNSAPVNVHVLQTPNPGVASQFAQSIAQGTGSQLQGARVQSPAGMTYEGYSVRTPAILVFILVNPAAGNIIIFYTPRPEGFDATQRLAGSVGNGRGLTDYPQVVDTFGALPASAPPGYSMTRMQGFTGAEIISALNQTQSNMDPRLAQTLSQIIQAVRMLIPDRGTVARYENSQGREKGVLIGSYGTSRKASAAYRILSWTLGFAMKRTKAAGFDALMHSDSDSKVMIFQKGPYIGLAVVPASATESELAELARSLQF